MRNFCIIGFMIITYSLPCLTLATFKEKHGYISIDLIRQKSPTEQRRLSQKYGLNLDQYLKKGEPRTNDSISLKRYMDNEFYGEIVIGKPGQLMYVAFDTAWDLSWVISEKCQKLQNPACMAHRRYDNTRSSYYKPDGRPYNGDEGSYNFTGFYSYENISIAHSNVTNFSFVEMVDFPAELVMDKADGVMGLALQDEDGDYEPFFYTLYRQKKIKNNLFSIFLNRDFQSKQGGNIMLGFINDKHIHTTQKPDGTKVKDTIKYLNVDPGIYWQFSVDKIVITGDNKPVNYTLCPNGCKAVADSSTNSILGPTKDVQYILNLINAKKKEDKWLIPCEKTKKLPKINFVLDGQYFRIGGPQYIMKMTDENYTTTCVVAFKTTDAPSVDTTWVLGGAFLSQYYSIYNIEERKIGFVRTP